MTPAEQLISAVRARLDELEQVAHGLATDWTAITLYPDRGEVAAADGEVVATTPKHEMATHIARHDPAAVLRRVAADRQILDLHEAMQAAVAAADGAVLAGAAKVRLGAYDNVLRALARGLGIDLGETPQ